MHHRFIAIFALLCVVLGGVGCASKSKSKHYKEVLLPKQTGSALQRRLYIETTGEEKKKPKEKKKAPKPETEPAETPPTAEEEAPPPERFR
jgi:predicted component of type VI protein secretion system